MTRPAHARAIGSLALGVGAALAVTAGATLAVQAQPKPAAATACPGDNFGITLAPGFCATVYADNLGHIRHLAFGPGGVLYANVWSGSYYAGSPVPADGFLLAIQDKSGGGKADSVVTFGEKAADGAHGGTGIAVYKGYVYAEVNDKIVRYALGPNNSPPTGKPEVVLSGMPLGGDHPMHPFIIDPKGRIFVDMGTATNACQAQNRKAGVPGVDPCIEKETRGGTWLYSADKLDQKFSPAERYVTGLRNGEGFAFDAAGRLFATQHGRDQLPSNWPKLYTDLVHATELPSEELVMETKGADFGWPNCYYDNFQKKLVLAPEYGGDGGKTVGVCAQKTAPVAAFPAHWAPNDLTIYKAKAFPGPYQGGAFIAFHGSWNRAPQPQAGYNVVYQPMADGKASGDYVVFADGFAGGQRDPGKARFRPMGLAVGPDGALYIGDDVKGRIWKVRYQGPAGITSVGSAAPMKVTVAKAPDVGALPVPPGSTRDQLAAGDKVFHTTTCTGCHGTDAKGTPLGPDLTSGKWLWSDGGLAALSGTIAKGVPAPKQYRAAMPPMGGAQLSQTDLAAVSAYVWAVGHQAK